LGGDRPDFAELMIEAHRATVALDGVTRWDGAKATAAALRDGNRVHSELLNYRATVKMTMTENSMLQNALDLIRARLRFFEESV
jgi:hypothetical protein